MAIQKLPEHIINRLKAWEIVERPAAILKELVENSLDANATKISINIEDGWKKLLQVEDNWHGIKLSDMNLLLERYATSKIKTAEDLNNIQHYWFRWEALASISEVSRTTIISKTEHSQIWTKLNKLNNELIIKHVPTHFQNGTIVTIEDLFFNVPARLKFLKSAQTEYYYCYNIFTDIALQHRDKSFLFKKNWKLIFDLKPEKNILQRIDTIFKKNISQHLQEIRYENEDLILNGYISNPNLRFWSWENIKFFVNGRPIKDKIIRRALLDAYKRQITPGEYPFALLTIDIHPAKVDVNVHPRKNEVRFADPQNIYHIINSNIQKILWSNQITIIKENLEDKLTIDNKNHKDYKTNNKINQDKLFRPERDSQFKLQATKANLSSTNTLDKYFSEEIQRNNTLWEYQVIWQLRNSYIIVQNNDKLYYIDQHALAERISFEKMKKEVNNQLVPKLLLQPISTNISKIPDIENKLEQLNKLWFDCSLLSEEKLIIYAIPQIFNKYRIDLESLFNHIFYLEEISFEHILDNIFATKACKTSIKAGNKLSFTQMQNLIQEWFETIKWLFVCQHWRPFFIEIPKNKIDKLFDR